VGSTHTPLQEGVGGLHKEEGTHPAACVEEAGKEAGRSGSWAQSAWGTSCREGGRVQRRRGGAEASGGGLGRRPCWGREVAGGSLLAGGLGRGRGASAPRTRPGEEMPRRWPGLRERARQVADRRWGSAQGPAAGFLGSGGSGQSADPEREAGGCEGGREKLALVPSWRMKR
jgi:hypothetical protein